MIFVNALLNNFQNSNLHYYLWAFEAGVEGDIILYLNYYFLDHTL